MELTDVPEDCEIGDERQEVNLDFEEEEVVEFNVSCEPATGTIQAVRSR